MTGNFTMNLIG